jgi:hypothetical protein
MKSIIIVLLMLASTVSISSNPGSLAQSITISIDDVSDPQAIPDLLAQLGYTGPNGAAAKAAFIKAYIINDLKGHIRSYRKTQAAIAAEEAASNIPIN